jgi:hypothetical protein
LVEAHIKGKLRELMTAYARIEQSLYDIEATRSFRGWLRDTQESLARFSATLTAMAFVRKIAAALWPLAIGLVAVSAIWTTLFKVLGKEMGRRGDLVTIAIFVLFTTVYIVGGLSSATRNKRQLFLEPISISPTWVGNPQDSVAGSISAKNVYEAEDELFGLIGTPKRSEPALDIYFTAAAFISFAVLAGIRAIEGMHDWAVWVFQGVVAIGFLVAGIYLIFSSFRRAPR